MLADKTKISFVLLFFSICPIAKSQSGGFGNYLYNTEQSAPGMILIEGGTFTLKNENEPPVKKKMNSFYISANEETNGEYLAYLRFIKKYYSKSQYSKALPDTTVWLKENLSDSIANYLSKNYLRNTSFHDYPVVGLTPEQILNYCKWKTDRVNEMLLICDGILELDTANLDSTNVFTLDVYYPNDTIEKRVFPITKHPAKNDVRMEDGIYMPSYRLPTEDEWKLASLAIGNEKNTYVKTPPEICNKTFDKNHYFSFLYVNRKGAGRHIPKSALSKPIPVKAVYDCKQNNYLIYGLYDNVSELIRIKKDYSAIGGSWKTQGPYYSSIYDNSIKDSVKYKSPYDFKAVGDKSNIVSAQTGFRLAMNFEVYYEEKLPFKRRKVK